MAKSSSICWNKGLIFTHSSEVKLVSFNCWYWLFWIFLLDTPLIFSLNIAMVCIHNFPPSTRHWVIISVKTNKIDWDATDLSRKLFANTLACVNLVKKLHFPSNSDLPLPCLMCSQAQKMLWPCRAAIQSCLSKRDKDLNVWHKTKRLQLQWMSVFTLRSYSFENPSHGHHCNLWWTSKWNSGIR